jgi:hypothetical protein
MTPPKLQTGELETTPEPLITAIELERDYRIPKASSYRLAKSGEIPHYKVGPKRTGIRFIASEVLQSLRQPAQTNGKAADHDQVSRPRLA